MQYVEKDGNGLHQKMEKHVSKNSIRLSYKKQSVNVVQGNSRCLFWDPRRTRKYTAPWVQSLQYWMLKRAVVYVQQLLY